MRRRDQRGRTTGSLCRDVRRLCGAEASRWERHGSASSLANAATERRADALPALPLLQHAAPSRLRLGMGQLRGMVEQSQANQLAMPLMCSAALLFRGRLSASGRNVSRSRKAATAGVVVSLRAHLAGRGGGSWSCIPVVSEQPIPRFGRLLEALGPMRPFFARQRGVNQALTGTP